MFWLAVWQIVYQIIGRDLLVASPYTTFLRVVQLAATGAFWQTIAVSLVRVMAGFLTGILAGVLLGVLAASNKIAEALIRPVMNLVKATPVASFVVLALIWISGKHLSSFIAFLIVLPMIEEHTKQGVQSADRSLLEVCRLYRLGKKKTILAVYLPAVMPHLLPACRVALGYAWKAGIAGEVIAIPQGTIGTKIYQAKITLETGDLFAWTAVIVLLSVLLERLIAFGIAGLEGRWKKKGEETE